jgi:hypothetical protein
MGLDSELGDTGTTPAEQSDSSPSKLAEAAKGMAEIADQVKALREGLRSLREGMLVRATAPPENGELHEVAVELEESAQHLCRAVELVSPTVGSAESSPESEGELPLPEGLRTLIGSLRAAGWSDEQVVAYLRRELDVRDASAAVARAWDHPLH